MIARTRAIAALALALCGGAASAASVEWEFPLLGSCHEGLAFADGTTGVLVWGGGDTLRLTVGRADLWDHRGGYPWTSEQSYTNIVAAVRSGDRERLYGLFRKVTPKGEPRNPYMLPLGRVEVTLPGATLLSASLDPFTGLGAVRFRRDGAICCADLAMSKASHAFALRLPADVEPRVRTIPAMEQPRVKSALAPLGFAPATLRADGFDWALPADRAVSLDWSFKDGNLCVSTRRAPSSRFGGEGAAETKCPSPRSPCLGGALAADSPRYADVARESAAHWAAFWREGARVALPDARLQRLYDYGMYRFGAMTDPEGVPAGLQGPWLEDDRLVPWNGDYHFNINVQECYSPAFRGGHFAHLLPLFRMVLSWRPRLRENARLFCGIPDGYTLPHSVDDRGVCIGGFWTGTIDHASTAWMASLMYRYVRYSGDVAFLKEGAYDFMKGAMAVYRALMSESDGRLALPLGPSPEWGGDDLAASVGRNPSFQLAAAHRLARDLVSAAERLGEMPDPTWRDVIARLPTHTANDSGLTLFEGQELTESHRHHSHLAGYYPFDILDVTDERLKKATLRRWVTMGTGLWSGWCVPWASILNTHFERPETAVWLLQAWERFFNNRGHASLHDAILPGFTMICRTERDLIGSGGGQVMQMDGQCAAVTAILELLVHDVNGKTEYFRGCPREWKDVSFENVRLADGTRVSGRRIDGKVTLTTNPHPAP